MRLSVGTRRHRRHHPCAGTRSSFTGQLTGPFLTRTRQEEARGPPQNKIYKTRGAGGSSSTDDMRLAGLAFLVSLSHSAAFLSPLDVRHASIKLQNRAAFVPVGARAAPTLRRGRALPQQPTAMGQMMQGEGETDKPVMSPFVTPALGAEETREWIWRGYRIRLSTPWSRWDAVRASARKKIFR